jgi:tryptophan-rich sensory protein
MKKAYESLIILVVILALVAFIALSLFIMYKTYITTGDIDINPNIFYVANILTGLIGGIVAIGFGVPAPKEKDTNYKLFNRKMIALGGLVTTGKFFPERNKSVNSASTNNKDASDPVRTFGIIYAISYIIIGFAALIFWMTDDKPPDFIKNISTVF